MANKNRPLFTTRKNPGDLSRTFCIPKPTLTGFCWDLNPTDARGGTTVNGVPANLIANTIFLKICLQSQLKKNIHILEKFLKVTF